MPLHRESKTFFYHIPKCAGSSIEEAFGMRSVENLFLQQYNVVRYNGVGFSLQHLTPAAISKLYPEFADFESFVITRNPYEKCVSSYCWLMQDLEKRRFFRFREKAFLRWVHEFASRFDIDHTLPQSSWVDGVPNRYDINDYDSAFSAISDRIGRPVIAEYRHAKTNTLNTKKLTQGLSSKTLEAIYLLYEEDFDKLKYTKTYS